MFDWFFDFLYLLTRSMFKIIDAMVYATNTLCGISPVIIDGKKTDLMEWMMSLEQVATGFKVTALVGIFLIVFFAIWGIMRNIMSDEPKGTPSQVAMKAFKTLLTFLFIPAAMYVLTKSLNAIAEVLYYGTRGGAEISLGGFLAKSFGQDCANDGLNVWTAEDFDYTSFDCMWKYFNMRHYDYFFSWVAGVSIIMTMSKVLFIFVERLFSIILLYIISPIPVSAAMIDDGAKFKAWREQLLAKYCTGYGAILGLNIYTIVISALCTHDIEYFTDGVDIISAGFLNFVFKLIIIIGGAFGVDKLVAMIGNLVSNGAGDAAMQEAGQARAGVGAVGQGAYKLGKKVGGFVASKVGQALGLGGGGGGGGSKGGANGSDAAAAAGGGAGGGGGGGGSGNANPTLDSVKEGFSNFGNKVKSTFKGLFASKKGGTKGALSNKKGAPKGVTKGQGSNGGFTLGLKNPNQSLIKK